ncbi:STAS domain-containing protein [Thiomicrorhabdus sediminis]|uniref:STAS domain-containing protein n=1 Tax=Thiomicrorhabdus sediminis TaxID=2580412 RepID=A0A4P9K666_9GAMM|nr:STAS domain-containing protein [Thiomicrorhabdus sediminis]QCU90321.1 STAS domain-containing protein [Thiomicrorhabdus sediminis]
MALKSNYADQTLTIHLASSFEVSQYEEFKRLCAEYYEPENRFVIDFKKTLYMDSSALGMLLLLREQTGGDRSKVKLININDTVYRILQVAQFNKLFSMQRLNEES